MGSTSLLLSKLYIQVSKQNLPEICEQQLGMCE